VSAYFIAASVAAWALTFDGALSLSGLRLSAVRDYTGTLPQCKAIARPPLAGGFVGFHRHRQIINISDTLNHVAARVPAVDAVSEIRLDGCHKGVSARKRVRSFYTDFWYLKFCILPWITLHPRREARQVFCR
jgi:hypothetical protein